jgi:heptosyltransferase-3
MSVSLNVVKENSNVFIKKYKGKKPLWKYYIRSYLDIIGFRQPVEYYNKNKRLEFETNIIRLWNNNNLNTAKFIKTDNNKLYISKILGQTIQQISISNNNKIPQEILIKLFKDLSYRHNLAIKYNEPRLCHIDSNLNNIILSDNQIFHIDFEMGREYEKVDLWIEREVSKLLVSIIKGQNNNTITNILELFIQHYKFSYVIDSLISKKLNRKFYKKNKKISNTSLLGITKQLHSILNKDKKYNIKFPVKSILVIYSARFGDILLLTPAIRAIYQKWPDAKITFMTHPDRLFLLENIKFITKIKSISNTKSRVLKYFSPKKYDLSFVFNKNHEKFVRYALSASKYTIAFNTGNIYLDYKLLYGIDYPKQHSMHSVDMRFNLLKPLNIHIENKQLHYAVSKEEYSWAKNFIQSNIKSNKLLIGIQANSFHAKSFRDWPIENFIKLCRKIMDKHNNAYFLIFGGSDDIKTTSVISNNLKNNSILLAGKLTLRQTAAIMQQLDFYIGVDTGPTHIMGTMNKPMVVLYHNFASSELLKPLENKLFTAIDHPVKEHGNNQTDMLDITVDTVYNTVNRKLNSLYEKI